MRQRLSCYTSMFENEMVWKMLPLIWKGGTNESLTRHLYMCHSTSFSTWLRIMSLRSDWLGGTTPLFPCRVSLWGWIHPISIDLGRVLVPFCLCGQLGPDWICFWVINLEDPNSLQRDPCVDRCFCAHLFVGEFLSTHLEGCVWLPSRQRDRWTCLLLTRLGSVPGDLDPPTGRKDTFVCSTWRIISRGFFLYGTWSGLEGCSNGISLCLGLVCNRTRGVDVWLNLGNLLRCLHRRIRNNLWRDTWSIPNDPIGCRFLLSLELGQDEQGRIEWWFWGLPGVVVVVKDSWGVPVVLLSAWRESLGTRLDRIRWECLWRRRRRRRRSVTIFSLQGISYVFLNRHASRCERLVLVLIFQDVLLTFSFQCKGSDPQRVVFFVG